MPDPVSWLLVRRRWRVVSADGAEVGKVDEVLGEEGRDIFTGLAIATSTLGKPRFVPSEQVAAIEEGTVHLSITGEECDRLAEYGG